MTPKQRGRNTRRNSEGTPKQRRNPEGTPKKPRSFSASKKTRMNQRCYFLLFGLVEKVCSLNLPMELVFRMTVQYDYTESIVGIGMYFGFYRQLIAGSGSSWPSRTNEFLFPPFLSLNDWRDERRTSDERGTMMERFVIGRRLPAMVQ